MSPVIPHFTKECLEMINIKENVSWPTIDEEFLIEEKKKYIVQINGKTRDIITGDKDLTEEDLLIKINQNSKLRNYINNKTELIFLKQNTLRSPINLSGVVIHNGRAVNMTIEPTKEDTGIIFKRLDLSKNNIVEANAGNIDSSYLCTRVTK